jgi:hypothetical protein
MYFLASLFWDGGVVMKKMGLWMPVAGIFLASCSSSPPLPPHMKYDDAVKKYGAPSHVDRLSDGGTIDAFQRKAGSASITTTTLTFDAAGQCIGANIETKGTGGRSPSDDLDDLVRLRNECYSHTFDAH